MEAEKELSMKQRWENIYSSVSFDGFHYMFDTKGIRRFFWTTVVLCASILAIMLFYGVLDDFFKHKTTTSTEEIFLTNDTVFPTVTICNLNSVSNKKLAKTNVNVTQPDLIKLYKEIRKGTVDLKTINTQKIFAELKAENITSVKQIISMYELSLEEMLNDPVVKALVSSPCMFKGNPCYIKDFKPLVSEAYGVCFQFHSFYMDTVRYAEESGEGTGLQLYLNIHESEMLISRVPYHGLSVFVHPLGTPFESALAKRVPVQPGSMTFIKIKTNLLELLPAPYRSKCDTKPYKYVKSNVPYTQSMCAVDCVMEDMMKKCGCVALEVSHHTDSKTCTLQKLGCIETELSKISKLTKTCQHKCPIECSLTRYDLQSSQTTLGNKIVVDKLIQLKNYNFSSQAAQDYVLRNLVGIDVAFSDIVYSKETVSATQNWITVLSAIGGSLGLCLGCSLITFIEFIVFGIEVLVNKCRRTNTDKNARTA